MTEKTSLFRTASGIITHDPLSGAPPGSKLTISAKLFQVVSDMEQLRAITNWEFFGGAVVAIHFGNEENQHILGSGVMAAPGVIIAARHVIEAHEPALRAGKLQMICTGIVGDQMVIWRVSKVTLVGNGDFALLMIRCASQLPDILQLVTFTTRMPRVGERLVIAGVRHHAPEPVSIASTVNMSMMGAKGTVTARYENARDKVLLPAPCVEVDCAAVGGMSGGPAFDEQGFLVGLVTSSIEGSGPTFVSLLWPAFAEPIEPIWPDKFYKRGTSLLAMDRRICAIHRADAITITENSKTGTKTATYHHWDQPDYKK